MSHFDQHRWPAFYALWKWLLLGGFTWGVALGFIGGSVGYREGGLGRGAAGLLYGVAV
jgi:hypothetical protein